MRTSSVPEEMIDLFNRLFAFNAHLFADALRALADQLDSAAPGPPVVAFPVLFSDGEELVVGSITVADDSGPLSATVTFRDAKGYETQPSGTPQWSSTDRNVASIEASEDGLSATITVGAPGAAVIECSETDESGEEIVAQGTVTVQPGDAEIGDVNFGVPTAPGAEQPEATDDTGTAEEAPPEGSGEEAPEEEAPVGESEETPEGGTEEPPGDEAAGDIEGADVGTPPAEEGGPTEEGTEGGTGTPGSSESA